MRNCLDRKRPSIIPVTVKHRTDLLNARPPKQEFEIPKVGLRVEAEILISDVSTADDSHLVIDDHCLIVHAVIETIERGEVEKLSSRDSTGAPLKGVEYPVFDIRMRGHRN